MANTVIVGINWGDEGKGRMVDLLTDHASLALVTPVDADDYCISHLDFLRF